MSVQTAVKMTVGCGVVGAATYDVLTIMKTGTSGNVSYVSSLTDGKTFRAPGNLDATWEITLKAPNGTYEVPAELRAGQIIVLKTPSGSGDALTMIVDTAALEIDIEAGELLGISLSCSANAVSSYL